MRQHYRRCAHDPVAYLVAPLKDMTSWANTARSFIMAWVPDSEPPKGAEKFLVSLLVPIGLIDQEDQMGGLCEVDRDVTGVPSLGEGRLGES